MLLGDRTPAFGEVDVEIMVCSFCGKGLTRVAKLIAGPGTYICDECTDLCNHILEEELPSWRWQSTSEPDYVAAGGSSEAEPRLEDSRRDEQVVRFTPEVVESDLGDVWDAFKDRQDENARRALFWHYWPLVESVASEVQMKWALALEHGRLTAPGYAGLSSALDTFGRDRGDTFETYAVQHIKATIIETLRANLNELEAIDFTPKRVRTRWLDAERVTCLSGCGTLLLTPCSRQDDTRGHRRHQVTTQGHVEHRCSA